MIFTKFQYLFMISFAPTYFHQKTYHITLKINQLQLSQKVKQPTTTFLTKTQWGEIFPEKNLSFTGKSLSEAVIFASTNPQYDKKLFIELQV